jgi:hypothetical protein
VEKVYHLEDALAFKPTILLLHHFPPVTSEQHITQTPFLTFHIPQMKIENNHNEKAFIDANSQLDI